MSIIEGWRKNNLARGDAAKVQVGNMIRQAFGANYVGYADKKYYVWANDGVEKVQIAISLTCPKTGIDGGSAIITSGGRDFSEPAQISEKEQQDILDLMKKLGL